MTFRKYRAPPRMLSRASNRLVTPIDAAVSGISIMMPRAPFGDSARAFHCDSW